MAKEHRSRMELPKKDLISKLFVHFIVISLFAIVLGKAFFNHGSTNVFLYIYGILVTGAIITIFLIVFLKYKDPWEKARLVTEEEKKHYLVSCLVAVKNEEKVIAQCVSSFLKQTYKNIEIIFIDDGSTDRTGEILERFAQEGLIKLISLENNIGKKKALVKGVLISKGDIFAFSDSDSVLAPDAISKIVDIFNTDLLIGGVSGHCRALNGDQNIFTKAQDAWYEGQFSVKKAFESCYGAVTCVSGPLAAFRREAIYNFMPAWENDMFLGQEFKFATDRTLTGFVLGSLYIGDNIKNKWRSSPFLEVDYPVRDWKILYTKAAKVWTIVPDTFGSMLKQ